MKVCLIRPPQLVTKGSIGNKAAAPIGIAFLGAVLEKECISVSLIDAIAEDPESLEPFMEGVFVNGLSNDQIAKRIPSDVDVIGLSLMFTMNWLHDRTLIKHLKDVFPKALIIAGGEHITALPEYSIQQSGLDVCVLGEGELTIVDLLNTIRNGEPLNEVQGLVFKEKTKIIRTLPRKRQLNITELPWPSWHLLPVNKYFEHGMVFGVDRGPCLPIMASRGCPYLCTFCSSPDMWGTRYSLRDAKDVVDEMESLKETYGVTNIDFYDLTAIVKRRWIIEMCDELIARNLNLTWQLPSGTRSEAIDTEVVTKMYASGCRNVTYAPESGSEELLRIIKKKVKLKNLLSSARSSVIHNLNVKVNIIIGLPGETHKHILQTLYFLIKCSWVGVHDTSPGLFYPYPGSKIFDDLRKTNKINLEDDVYMERLIFTDSITRNYAYNDNMGIKWIRFYQIMILLVFYGTNYLFRPLRIITTVKNILSRKYESRLEMTFSDWLKTNKLEKAV